MSVYSAASANAAGWLRLRSPQSRIAATTGTKLLPLRVRRYSTFGGTSHIKLMFDAKSFALKQWQVTDPQGYDTLVSLFSLYRPPAVNELTLSSRSRRVKLPVGIEVPLL